PPRVTNAYRQAARGGPAPTVRPPSPARPRPSDPPTRRTRGQRTARVLSWIALTTAITVLLAAGGLWLAFNHYNGQIDRFDAFSGLTGGKRPAKVARHAQNYLLVGSDSRDGANGVGTQGQGATFVTGQRSDTVILVHLFGSSEKAELVSFPRDTYVEIPEFTNPATGRTRSAHFGKLNSAFSEGGAPLLIATIEHLTNVRIDHFLQVDFTGFKGMVNKLGGVDVCLTKDAKDHFSGINLAAGRHHVRGDVALAFVRQRHGLANGDIDRIARQQQFIGSLANKVLSAGTLLDPFKLNGFLDVATASLKADTGLSGNDIKNLALRLRSFNSGGVLFVTVPIADISGYRKGVGSVVLLDEAKTAQMFDALRRDVAPDTPATNGPKTPTTPIIVAPANVRVAVYNGSGVQGIGRKAAADITQVGFQVIGIPTNRGTGATQTTISYGPTKADSARTLQAAIPGSVLVADSSLGRTLDLVVGSGYNGAKPVTVTTARPSASPAPGAAVPVKTAANNPCTT
ncbi:MAG: cell envelope-related transcriptional attenuator, partial [Frankiales bacterium]|nr:cell envelope-related transcriptional attenuator [Frankiales bacterium]